MSRRKPVVVLLLALTSGGVASYLSLGSVSQTANAAPAPAPSLGIVVAARPLPAGTMVQAADVQAIPWATNTPPAGVFTRAEDVVGRVVTVAVNAHEPILASLLAEPGSGSGLPGLIPAGQRAISVSVDEVVGVNGFMGPRARVDVIATLEAGGAGAEAVSRVVLQDVEVLASGHQLQPDPNGAPQQATVATLLVTPAQAEALVLATHKGRIHLVLRGSADRSTVETLGMRSSALAGSTPTGAPVAAPTLRSERTSAGSRAPSAAPTPAVERVVEVYNGRERAIVRY